MFSDFRFALRQLARTPGFTLIVVLLLTLAIGANTAFFSVFKAQALAPLPYPEPDRVVQLWRSNGNPLESNPWSKPDFVDVHSQATSFSESGLYQQSRFNLGGHRPASLQGVYCTPGVLRTLGVQPALGRWFTDAEARSGGPRVVLLSHASWLTHFGGDPAFVGRVIRLNGESATVIGIMPAGFEFYCPGIGARSVQLWAPLPLDGEAESRGSHRFFAVGRLRPGATVGAANAELQAISHRLARSYPDTNTGKTFLARPVAAEIAFRSLFGFGLVIAAVAMVLIVAGANAAIMFLARGAGRQMEYAVRLSLGASRWQLIRLALAETVLTALVACAGGLLLTWHLAELLPHVFPPLTAHAQPVQLDGTVLGWSLLLTLVAAAIAGLPPALIASRTQVVATLKDGGATQAGSRVRHRFLHHLVSAQVGIALILTNTAFLLLVSYRSAVHVNEPLASEYVVTAGITVNPARYPSAAARTALWARVLERTRNLPGVSAAGMTTKLPLRGGDNFTILADQQSFDPKVRRPTVEQSSVLPGYFAAMGIRLISGRLPEPADADFSHLGVLVNRTLAEKYWPGQSAVGHVIKGDSPNPWFTATVIGVVDDVRQWDVSRPALPEVYFHYGIFSRNLEHLVIRSGFAASQLVPTLRRELAAIDSDLALVEPQTMAELVSDASRAQRNVVALVQGFMAITLVIACAGVYGTLSFQTRQRTREIGVRVALGAECGSIVALVFRQTLPWLAGGCAVGLTFALAIALVLRAAFADVGMLNPLYFVASIGTTAAVLAIAAWPTARRAAAIDPAVALRAE